MTHGDLLRELGQNDLVLTMLAEEIGERAVREPPESAATWETIGRDSIKELLDTPMGHATESHTTTRPKRN